MFSSEGDPVVRSPLLLMLVGLFIVIDGVERIVLTPDAIATVGRLHLDSLPLLSFVT